MHLSPTHLCVHCLIDIADDGLVLLGVLDDVGKDVVIATILCTVGDLVERVLYEDHLRERERVKMDWKNIIFLPSFRRLRCRGSGC